ncbi:hypothetical protein [Arsenicibacter rosenii]|uniref:Uncharacterized protein n=1 Tax=Arsenicibacter rosenii TaxID=1750698 RepID=A0A1S2VCD0_9BACT|nr:hypothetical protein [Arsenicibacter rosenii]OIN56339.1 hypothetical protein BLX24_25255 [Arsenicibacter rosenii]
MDKAKKFELMNKIVRELEDLQNSQTALIEKITKIEADNMNLNDSYLEKTLGDMHSKIAENLDTIAEIFTHFESQRDDYAKANNLSVEEPETETESTI